MYFLEISAERTRYLGIFHQTMKFMKKERLMALTVLLVRTWVMRLIIKVVHVLMLNLQKVKVTTKLSAARLI